jgi:hypothetical protein
LRLRFLNAGIRHENAPLLYFGAKTLLPLVMMFLVYSLMLAQGTTDSLQLLLYPLVTGLVACYLPNLVLRWMAARGTRKRPAPKSEKPEKSDKSASSGLNIAATALSTTVKQAGLNREVLFVPPSMPATDLLVRMQASRTHLAIVIDEYGGTEGLVSIEDLVEVIVGDIADEHDTEDGLDIKPVEDGVYLADGRVDLSQLEALLAIDLLPEDEEEEADTLAGLIFKIAGRVPARGEIIRHESGLEFEILDSDPRRVKRVRISARNANTSNSDPLADISSG